ncbi:MAG TPA: DUF5329 domain-containing protein [Woeseiaceae bacterium]|nr:DUF5329 domain-containing protein [Woeseiaceae bacterium]
MSGRRHEQPVPARSVARRLRLAFILLAGTAIAEGADRPAPAMDEEIDFLVAAVAGSDCTFIRNGREHDAGAASKHLQMKRERGRRHYDSTEEFIDRIASKSSWSGRDYLIRCDADEAQTAKNWFTAKLARYREDAAD